MSPVDSPEDYYNHKGWHASILQGMVNMTWTVRKISGLWLRQRDAKELCIPTIELGIVKTWAYYMGPWNPSSVSFDSIDLKTLSAFAASQKLLHIKNSDSCRIHLTLFSIPWSININTERVGLAVLYKIFMTVRTHCFVDDSRGFCSSTCIRLSNVAIRKYWLN